MELLNLDFLVGVRMRITCGTFQGYYCTVLRVEGNRLIVRCGKSELSLEPSELGIKLPLKQSFVAQLKKGTFEQWISESQTPK